MMLLTVMVSVEQVRLEKSKPAQPEASAKIGFR